MLPAPLPATLPAPLGRAPRRHQHGSLRTLLSSLLAARFWQFAAPTLAEGPRDAPRHGLGSFDLARSSLARALLVTQFRDAETNLPRAVRR